MEESEVPINYLTDGCGEIVDDCLAAIMGGKATYLEHLKKNKGTIFATTGYVETWKNRSQAMEIESLVQWVTELKNLFDMLGYDRVLILDDGLGDRDIFESDIRKFSQTFGLQLAREECSSFIFEQSYDEAKEMVWAPIPEMPRSKISIVIP
jgi:hypothetical protein